MGGTAFLIYGQMPDSKIQELSKGSFLGQLFKKQNIHVSKIGSDRELITIPHGKLQNLIPDFINFLNRSMPNPWAATKCEIDYIKMASTIYLRVEKSKENTEWYIQFSLSGCSGMADVSADLGYHWLCKWYKSEGARIKSQFLAPFGFTATNTDEYDDLPSFLPIAKYGHASFRSSPLVKNNEEENTLFDIDYSATETLGVASEEALKQLEDVCGNMSKTNECYCQMCQPNLDLSYFEKLTLFKE